MSFETAVLFYVVEETDRRKDRWRKSMDYDFPEALDV